MSPFSVLSIWAIYFASPILPGFTLVVWGLILKKFPPKSINTFYAYKTLRSMENSNNWQEASRFSSQFMIRYGIYLIFAGVALIIASPSLTTMVLANLIGLFASTILISIKTEARLKQLSENNSNK
jgi:uncharacterized membrane protein